MDSFNLAMDKRRAMLQDLRQAYVDLRREIQAEQNRRLEDLQSGQARLTEELRNREQQIRARFNELSRYWDRFM